MNDTLFHRPRKVRDVKLDIIVSFLNFLIKLGINKKSTSNFNVGKWVRFIHPRNNVL